MAHRRIFSAHVTHIPIPTSLPTFQLLYLVTLLGATVYYYFCLSITKITAFVTCYTDWIDMCAKRNYYITHDKISPCRSKRHERHIILPKSTVTDKNEMVIKKLNSVLFSNL